MLAVIVATIVAAGAVTLKKSSKKMSDQTTAVQTAANADAFVEIQTSEGDITVRLSATHPSTGIIF